MPQIVGSGETESWRTDHLRDSLVSLFELEGSGIRSMVFDLEKDDRDVEYAEQWNAIERLPSFKRLRSSLIDRGVEVVDVTKLGSLDRRIFVEKLIKHIENDNLRLLKKIRARIDK